MTNGQDHNQHDLGNAIFFIPEGKEDLNKSNPNHNPLSYEGLRNQDKDHINLPKRQSKLLHGLSISTGSHSNNYRLSSGEATPRTETSVDFEEILKFPSESPHAYSYAHLSPNSLALRLNVLKRSLEILKDRPSLFKSINFEEEKETSTMNNEMHNNSGLNTPVPFSPYISKLRNNSADFFNRNCKLESNASSAALSALFRPNMRRADSLPIDQIYSTKRAFLLPTAKFYEEKMNVDNPLLNDDIKDVIELIEKDSTSILTNSEIASTLHDISLSTNKLDHKIKQDFLKNRLLYALATPFVEKTFIATKLLKQNNIAFASNTYLSSLNNSQTQTGGGRPFPSLSSGKHTLPQSIFTITAESPWHIKAANDLACLMFGALKKTIKALTLMDLIAPQFRNLVADRLSGTFSLSPKDMIEQKNQIYFAGEILAISITGRKEFAWTSIWAKRKDDLIICMFDEIHSDAFDLVVLCDKESYSSEMYHIDKVSEIAGNLVARFGSPDLKDLTKLSESIALDLKMGSKDDDKHLVDLNAPQDVIDSDRINRIRYYTLKLGDADNVPCAISSNPTELEDDRYEIKLKIHSLPYIAGMFVISSTTHNILSCNNAIAKNLFGRSGDFLSGKPINYLIPKFDAILLLGLELSKSQFSIVQGLVLPEHFFRRYDALLKHKDGDLRDEEELFFNSNGVEGKHRDGNIIYVDVQLRVSSNETYALWVTYSRLENKSTISKELDKLNSSTSSISLSLGDTTERKRSRLTSFGKENLEDILPSQLSLLSDEGSEKMEFVPSRDELNRTNSTRKPKADCFILPLKSFNQSSTSLAQASSDIRSSDASVCENAVPNSSSTQATTVSQDEKVPEYQILGPLDANERFSELQLLKMENKILEDRKSKSKLWPSTLGSKRRTKKITDFKVTRQLGEGAYSKVVLAQHNEDPDYEVIIKCIDKERILVDTWVRDRKLGTIPSEIQIMAFLNTDPHPNIQRIVDFFEDRKYYYLETPLFGDPPAIDVFDFIEIKEDLSELECQIIFKQIVMAVYHLHKHGIIHRDIKDENVIIDENGFIKLIDFGSAGYTKQGPFDVFVGTMDYASPEVLRGQKYDGKPQDVWALGILLYTLLYKENPFYNVDEIMEGNIKPPYIISEKSINLVEKILVKDVNERPTITDIADDDWLNL